MTVCWCCSYATTQKNTKAMSMTLLAPKVIHVQIQTFLLLDTALYFLENDGVVIWWAGGTYTLNSTLEQLGLKNAILVAIKNKTERVVVDHHLEAFVLWIWLPTSLRLWSNTTIPSLPLPSLYSTWASKVSLQHSSMCLLLSIWGWWWPNSLVFGKSWYTNSDSARYII